MPREGIERKRRTRPVVADGHGETVEVNDHLSPGEGRQPRVESLVDDDGDDAVLDRVRSEDVRDSERDDNAKPGIGQRPGGVLP